jgi:DNA-binding MarR family transcriptional regulator
VTPSQARALGVLTRHGPVRLGTLSEHLRIAPRSTTEVVDILQARGLVERHPDPKDRRATFVELTPEGHRVGDAIDANRAAEAERIFGALSAGDREQLARILRTLHG